MKDSIFGLALVVGLAGCASDRVTEGNEAVKAGQYDRAAALWDDFAIHDDMEAQYYKGTLSEQGYGLTRADFHEATYWYSTAAWQGHIPSMVALSRLQLQSGYPNEAFTWLVLAPRNANREASDKLPAASGPVLTMKDYWLTGGEISHLERLQNFAETRAIEGAMRLNR